VKKEFTTEGRKTPLQEIRRKMLMKQEQYLRKSSDQFYNELTENELKQRLVELNELYENEHLSVSEMRNKLKYIERTRNLLVWLDNSTVANHGYLVCLVTCLYDPAVFLTDQEYKAKTGKNIKIQKVIEEPEVHFIARCGSSEHEQLLYCETRLKCIQGLKSSISIDSIEYKDTMRFCHGDSPQRAFEAGQQKGGNYFCASCGIHCQMVADPSHALNCKLETLQKKQIVILQGAVSRRNSIKLQAKPLKGLSKAELEEELASRGNFEDGTKKDLQDNLTEILCGKQRVPALLFNVPEASLKTLCLDRYEILPCEPLHDIGHHIENFFSEFPRHISDAESKLIDECVETCLGGKESKRTVDHRAALVKTAAVAHQSNIMSAKTLSVIDTLVQMQEILYSPDDKRSPALILRYCNQAWYHAILLKTLIDQPKKLTRRKMFGIYFHNLSTHAGLMLRLISGQASNAEAQEIIFNSIKRITKQTSNNHPGHIIPNLFIRLQAEKEMELQGDDVGKQQAHISNLAKSLPPATNTCIPISIIKKYNHEWQAHLQQISDYLIEGEGVWWSKNDDYVEFHDVTNHPSPEDTGPFLHHFRSSTLENEADMLDDCWYQCITSQTPIPTNIIRYDESDGTTTKLYINFLNNSNQVHPPTEEDINNDQNNITDSNDFENIHPSINPSSTNYSHPTRGGGEEEEKDDEEEVISISPIQDETINLEGIPSPQSFEIINDQHELNCSPVSNQDKVSNITESNPSKQQEMVVEPTHYNYSCTLQTHLGKALEVVMGPTEEVKSLDHQHHMLKKMKKQNSQTRNKQLEDKYVDALASIQVKILKEKTTAEEKLKAWEKDYVMNHNLRAPSLEEMKTDQDASLLIKKVKYANALLKEWNIQF